MAAGLAVMKFLKQRGPALQRETNERTARFVKAMNAFFEERRLPMRLQGFSALFFYDFHPDLKYAPLLFYYMRDRGIHIWEGRVGHLSIAHTDQDMEFLLNAFKASVTEMQENGFLPASDGGPPRRRATGRPPGWRDFLLPRDQWRRADCRGRGIGPACFGQGGRDWRDGRGSSVADARSVSAHRGPDGDVARRPDGSARRRSPHHGSNYIQITGPLDVAALNRAITDIINRHEAFRCTFSPDGSELLVSPSVAVEVPLHDLSNLPPADRDARVAELLSQEGKRLLDLVKGPLFAFQLIRLSPEEHLLVFTVQMIICDGWGYTIVLDEISAVYSALVEGRTPSLGPATPLRDYVQWQRTQADTPEARECEQFWLSRFQTMPPPLDLPSFKPRPAVRSFAGARQNLRLSADFHAELKRTAKELKSTPFAILLAAYQAWLFRLSGLNDLVVGVPFAGQSGAALEALVGQCVQTLPLRLKLDPDEPFAGLLARTKELLFDVQEHWHYSFGKVVQKLAVPPDPSRIPLVSVIFNLDVPLSNVRFSGCRQHIEAVPRHYFQYDLGFNLVNEGATLLIECDYNRDLFETEVVGQWLRHFQSLLEGVVVNPQLPLRHLPILNDGDQRQRVVDWNYSNCEFSRDATVHGLISAQAARTPNAVALEFDKQRITYAELEHRSNRIANFLRSLGVGPDTLAGVCLERSPDMVIAMLGILKAGGAYVPIDPDLPPERLTTVIGDTDAPVLLTQGSLLPRLPVTKARMICLDEDQDVIGQQSTEFRPAGPDPANLAYVIYTSGSTGKPKGVEITHRSVVNFLESMRREPGMKSDDVVLAMTTLSFDIAVLELLLPLTLGARAVIVTRDALIDPEELNRKIKNHGVTIMQATPAIWRLLLNGGWTGDRRLKVLCGGEILPPDLAQRLLACCGELWNMYGPTETTVWSTCGRVQSVGEITIGHPIANTQVYIVDEDLQPVPVGVAGELVIGGVGLARGYRNLPALTAERFVPDPIAPGKTGRLYRTGDLARYGINGEIEIIGRMDFQVKIRGHRIELGEIESILLTHPRVREAIVVVREDHPDQPRLVAYLVAAEFEGPQGNGTGAAGLKAELRRLIRGKLPNYMLPSSFVLLPEIPRTPQGKADRLSLPPPQPEDEESASRFVAPRDSTEETLLQIWTETLKNKHIGVKDSFFDIGGQSLLAVSLFAKIERAFGRRLPLATLLRAPTIEQLAMALKSKAEASERWTSLVPIQPKGSKPPLFLIHGAGGNVLLYRWLAEHLAPDYPVYGLQSRGLDGKSEPLHTIEEMAVEYLREMRVVQPKGPYHIGGYCLGGTVAYEIAQILHREGETVPLIAMLDTYNFSRALKSSFTGFLWQKARFHFGNVVRLRPGQMWQYLREKTRVARDGELSNLLTSRPGSAAEEGVARATSGVEASVQAINDNAAEVYIPKPLSGRLTLFKPQANYKFYPDPKMGWGDLALDGLDIVEVSAYPHAMLVEPYVRHLASELKFRLDRAPAPPLPVVAAAA
jgi:amino acid adenylation domain-containing protein